MKAFLSHSSKDKPIVRHVAEYLGDMRAEIDEYTFDYKLTGSEIRAALKRSDLFVFLVSENSVGSNFVSEELRSALEARTAGSIKQVIVFALDDTSYRCLPEWMRELNVAQRLSTPKQLARRIDSVLTQLEIDDGERLDFYLGRDEDEAELRRLMAQPRAAAPTAVSVVGNFGVGRRTFLRHALQKASPRKYSYFIQLSVDEYDGVTEVYRTIYENLEVFNPITAVEDFAIFEMKNLDDKVSVIQDYLLQVADDGGMVIFVDDGGVFADNGDFRDPFGILVNNLEGFGRPVVGFVQSRMMKHSYKRNYSQLAHIRLSALSHDAVAEILSLTLNELNIEYTTSEIFELSKHIGGEPINVSLVASFVADEGVDVLLADPSEILEIRAQRGLEFLRRIELSDLEADVLCLLQEYRYCDLEFLSCALDVTGSDFIEAVRRLEDYCCIERRDRLLLVSPPLRDAVRRDKRLHRKDSWLTACASRVIQMLKEYTIDDSITMTFIDSALPDVIKSGAEIPFVSSFVLPSHFLRVARDYYNKGNWVRTEQFCRDAIESAGQLSLEGKIEVNRLLGLSLVRQNSSDENIDQVISRLKGYRHRTATRVAFFIEGFKARRVGDYDIAEEKFLAAAELDRENYHINRELSSVLCRVGRYPEAEPYARSAYARAQDNPYILDVLIEALEGMLRMGLSVNRSELSKLNDDLKAICESGGFKFYSVREARRISQTDTVQSLSLFRDAIGSEKSDAEWYFQRGRVFVRASAYPEASADVASLRTLAEHNPEAARYADELEVEILIAQRRYDLAKERLEGRFNRSTVIRERLVKALKRAISYEPSGISAGLKQWAKN